MTGVDFQSVQLLTILPQYHIANVGLGLLRLSYSLMWARCYSRRIKLIGASMSVDRKNIIEWDGNELSGWITINGGPTRYQPTGIRFMPVCRASMML